MSSLATPLQLTTIAAIAAWPLAAGLGLVMWTKVRASRQARRVANVDVHVRDMFRSVELTPMPDRLALVVDALEDHDAIAAAAATGRQPVRRRANVTS